jgi:hypothetical protein
VDVVYRLKFGSYLRDRNIAFDAEKFLQGFGESPVLDFVVPGHGRLQWIDYDNPIHSGSPAQYLIDDELKETGAVVNSVGVTPAVPPPCMGVRS